MSNSWEFFGAQAELRDFDLIEDFPFMLRRWKQCETFFHNLPEL